MMIDKNSNFLKEYLQERICEVVEIEGILIVLEST